MPYSLNNPPTKIKGLPKHAKEIWISAFNSAIKQYKDEGKANATAWSAVKKSGYKKTDGKWSKMADSNNFKKGDKIKYGPLKDNSYEKGKVISNPKIGSVKIKLENGKTITTDKDNVSKLQATTAGSLDPAGITTDKGFAAKKKKKLNLKKGGKIKMKNMCKFKKWTYTTKKALPDSAYAVVIKKGDKKIRKLPYKDASGKVDVPHLRNALARVAQGKTDLSPSQRAAAMRKLKAVAGKYLKTYKNTKSGEIMKASISKFEVSVNDRLNAIIDVLKKRAANRKPDDEISFPVKNIASLIQDLEEIVEIKKESEEEDKDTEAEEESDKGKKSDKEKKDKETEDEDDEDDKEDKDDKEKDKDKDEEEDDKDKEKEDSEEDEEEDKGKKKEEDEESSDSEEDSKDKDKDEDEEGKKKKKGKEKEDSEEETSDDEEESKFQELVKVCEGYKESLTAKDTQISKMSKQIKDLEKSNKGLSGEKKDMSKEISKFKADKYTKTLNKTVELVSKFRGLNDDQRLRLKEHYLTSKMSESALEEIGRKTEYQVLSKMSEPKETTKPSEHLAPAEQEKDFSKMSKTDQLDKLAEINAKDRGFVQ